MENALLNSIGPIVKAFDSSMHKAKVKAPVGEPPGPDQSSSPPPEEGTGVLSAIADVFDRGKKQIATMASPEGWGASPVVTDAVRNTFKKEE